MKQIQNLTSEPRQRMQLQLDNNETVDFYLYYYQTQNSWFFDFTYNDYTCYGQRVVLTGNALRHLKNIIPFGIGFVADGLVEPFKLDDFETERVQIILLNSDEVKEIEETVYYD